MANGARGVTEFFVCFRCVSCLCGSILKFGVNHVANLCGIEMRLRKDQICEDFPKFDNIEESHTIEIRLRSSEKIVKVLGCFRPLAAECVLAFLIPASSLSQKRDKKSPVGCI